MGFKTVKFTQELSIHGLSCWPSLEWDMQPGEDPQEVFTKIIAEIKRLNDVLEGEPAKVKDTALFKPEADPEFEAFKQKLSLFKYREEALAALQGSGYSVLNMEIKSILESLPVQG